MNNLAKKLAMKSWTDWYDVRVTELDEIGRSSYFSLYSEGQSMLGEYYSGSLVKALLNVFPEHPWNLIEFKHTPKGVLDSVNTQVSNEFPRIYHIENCSRANWKRTRY